MTLHDTFRVLDESDRELKSGIQFSGKQPVNVIDEALKVKRGEDYHVKESDLIAHIRFYGSGPNLNALLNGDIERHMGRKWIIE